MPRKSKIKVVGSETYNRSRGGMKRTIYYRTPTKRRPKGGKILNLNPVVFVKDLSKLKYSKK